MGNRGDWPSKKGSLVSRDPKLYTILSFIQAQAGSDQVNGYVVFVEQVKSLTIRLYLTSFKRL